MMPWRTAGIPEREGEGQEAGRATLVLVNLAGIMERADEALLPAVYQEVGAALGTTPAGLGSLTLFRSVVQSSCYPLAAYMAVRYNRAHVIALGAFLWAAATFLVAISSTFFQVAVSRALNGVGLAIVTPAIQSIVADSTDDSNRGTAFGWLQLTGNFGSILGGLFTLLLASRTFMGIPGWRVAFHLVGLVSVIVGILVRLFAVDPRFPSGRRKSDELLTNSTVKSGILELVKEAKAVVKIPSFQIIVAQGVTGSFPCPIFAEIVPEKSRTSIYALDRAFESVLSSFAPPVVGLLSEHVYGYKPVPQGSSWATKVETDRENAASLAKALYTAIAIPMFLCCLIYSCLYCTYPRDRDRARMDSLIASEMQQQIELENSCLEEDSSPNVVSELESGVKERSVIELVYGEEEFEVDDSDEKTLLPHQVTSSNERD
ncbi:hypothetical protein Taro_037667 [Colocasia esculenta]|uniref:Major facilitator superfamily (MFS) profile domain-containing protein n=1 Tax=Colocasia esculenta TaxID=4460 RepID=A0A843WGX8_COLES|nr:hypothetical protein [Colocasia esculenta]